MAAEAAPLLSPLSGHSAEPSRPARLRDFLFGISLLLAVVFLWTLSNFLTNELETGDFNKPWLLTYCGTASFSLYLLRPSSRRRLRQMCSSKPDHPWLSAETACDESSATFDEHQPLRSTWSAALSAQPELTSREILSLAFEFCLLWFSANYSICYSLSLASVSSVTILSATSGLWALGLGHVLGFSNFTFSKLAAVSISLIGVVLVCVSDREVSREPEPDGSNVPQHPIWGDALAILSAMLYACYVSLIKLRVGDESRLDMPLFLGLVGVINVLLLWPLGLALHLSGIEPFELPTGNIWWLVIINSAITLCSDYFYLIAMLLTSPLTVTLGLSLTIPLAVIGDLLLGHAFGGLKAIAGATLVVVSFVVAGLADQQEVAKASDL